MNITYKKDKFGNITVVRTIQTDKVIELLQPYFEKVKVFAIITSAKREVKNQLANILFYAKKYVKDFPLPEELNDTDTVEFEGDTYPLWQVLWSLILEVGVMIAPIKNNSLILTGKRKGQVRNATVHFTGRAFDIDALPGKSISEVYNVIFDAVMIDEVLQKHITKVLLERVNDVVHVEVADL